MKTQCNIILKSHLLDIATATSKDNMIVVAVQKSESEEM